MLRLIELFEKAKVIGSSIVTWLLVIEALLLAIVDQVAPLIPAPWGDQVTAIALSVLGIIAVAISIIRQVTRVSPDQRGLLPPK